MKTFKGFLAEVTLRLGQKKSPGLDSFMDEWHKTTKPHPFNDRSRIHGGTMVELSPFDGNIHLSDIQTLEPNKGHGAHTIKHITSLADKHGVTVEGTALAYAKDKKYITKSKDLKTFYTKHGFKAGRGSESEGYEISYKGKGS